MTQAMTRILRIFCAINRPADAKDYILYPCFQQSTYFGQKTRVRIPVRHSESVTSTYSNSYVDKALSDELILRHRIGPLRRPSHIRIKRFKHSHTYSRMNVTVPEHVYEGTPYFALALPLADPKPEI